MNNLQDKFDKLSRYEITLIQWRDKYKHWRLGLDWKSESEYYYICENPTIEKCLDMAIEYVETHK